VTDSSNTDRNHRSSDGDAATAAAAATTAVSEEMPGRRMRPYSDSYRAYWCVVQPGAAAALLTCLTMLPSPLHVDTRLMERARDANPTS